MKIIKKKAVTDMMRWLVDTTDVNDLSVFKHIKQLGAEDGYFQGRPKSSAVKGT